MSIRRADDRRCRRRTKERKSRSGGWGKWTRSFILCVINNHIIIVSICWLRRSYSICTLRPDLNLLVKWEMETWNEWVRIQQNFPFDQHGNSNSNMLQFAELQSSALSLKSTFFSLYCSSYPTQIKCTETRSWAEAQLRSVRVNDFSHFFSSYTLRLISEGVRRAHIFHLQSTTLLSCARIKEQKWGEIAEFVFFGAVLSLLSARSHLSSELKHQEVMIYEKVLFLDCPAARTETQRERVIG